MNVVRHDHVTPQCRTKLFYPALSIGFETSLRSFKIRNPLSVARAKCDEVNWLARINQVKTLGATFDHFLRLPAFVRAGETLAATTKEFFCGGSRPGCNSFPQARQLPLKNSANLHRDRQQMVDHVSAAIRIALDRLSSAIGIGRARDQRCCARTGRRLPIKFPEPPRIRLGLTE